MPIKDESRSIVRPEKRKKKRRAPVSGEQAAGGSKVPTRPSPIRRPARAARLPGVQATNQAETPMQDIYDIEGGLLSRLHGIRKSHMDLLAQGWAKDMPGGEAHQRRAINVYTDAIHALVSDVPLEEARRIVWDLQDNITDDETYLSSYGIQPETDVGLDMRKAINTYHEVLETLGGKYPGLFQSEDGDFPPYRPEEGTRGRRPASRRIPRGISTVERNRTPYRGSTNPAFARMGYSGDIFSFNQRAELANAAFVSQFGYEPSPGLLLDIMRAPVRNEEFEDLFKIPQTFQRARAQAAANEEKFKAEALPEFGEGQGVEESLATTQQALARQEQGVAPPLEGGGIVDDLGLPGLALYQIGESLVYAPAGLFQMGKALGYDVQEAAPFTSGGADFERSRKLGKDIAKGVLETYENPAENPGYILMDAFGLVSAGAGAGSRLSRAGRAKGLKARGKALATRRVPGTDELGGESTLLSENVAAEVVQRALNERRRRGLEKRRTSTPSSYAPLTRRDRLAGVFSTEAKIGREARARQRVEHQIAMETKRELDAVTGWSINSSRALSRMPNALKRGLTRGEQKAIQVLATDEPGGWQGKIALHRSFHEKMLEKGIGDPAAHTRQLADLQLAERALENPRGRFQEAADLTRQTMEESELLKIERLGLDADTARSRIAAFGEVLREGSPKRNPATIQAEISKLEQRSLREGEGRGQAQLDRLYEELADVSESPLPKLASESYYLPSTLREKSRRPVSERVPTARPGQYGIPEPRNIPELTHVFTGESIRWGDTRIDTTNLAGESYARAVRLAAVKDEHARLLAQATDKKMSEWDIPIRETKDIPDDLRAVVNQFDEGAVSKRDIDGLDSKFQEALYQHLFPDTAVKDVKWVDSRLIGDAWRYPNEPGFGTKIMTAINEPFRTATLFLRPAYALNLLGNSAMLMMQSTAAPMNLMKAARVNKRYGAKNARTLESLVSEGKALSFTPDDLIQTKVSRTLAHGWNALVDRKFRLAAIIHEAERKGYKSADDMTRLLDPKSADKKIKADRVEISRRANKALVEFNNLTPFEKNTMRHLIFVYPWVSRSVVWSLKTMVDHPLKTWSLVQLGKEGEKFVEEELGEELPEWFTQTGYFPVHTDDEGRPLVVNPTSINTFSTFNEMLQQAKGLGVDTPYTTPGELLGPAGEFGVRLATGQDAFGTDYETGTAIAAAQELFKGLPQVAAIKRGAEADPNADPSKRPSFVPGGLGNVYGPLIAGGFWPRTADTEALASDWARDQPKEIREGKKAADRLRIIKERLSVERRAIMQAEKITSEILGKPIPQEVRDALELQMRFTEAYANSAAFTGKGDFDSKGEADSLLLRDFGSKGEKSVSATFSGGPGFITPLGKRLIQVKVLNSLGRIDDDTFQNLVKGAGKAADKGSEELEKWGAGFAKDYLNADALSEWWLERNQVLDIVAKAPEYLDYLRKSGFYQGGAGKPKQEDLMELGRQYVGFSREMKARAEDTGARGDLETLDNSLDRAWIDEQDKPVTVDGKKFPSPVRLGWARKSQEERLNDIADFAVASWDTLSNFEKEVVGKKVAPKVSYGWVVANAIMDGFRGNLTGEEVPEELRDVVPEALPEGEREIDRAHKLDIAKYVDKHYAPGFYKDFLFAIQPKFERVRVLPVITKSKANDEWSELMQAAGSQYAYIKRAREMRANGNYKVGYTITGVQDQWDDYAKNTLYPYIQKESSDVFKKELELLGGIDFLRTLIAD